MPFSTQQSLCWTLGIQQWTHILADKVNFNKIIAKMITTKCVTVMSSSPEEESGFLDCPLEDVTFRLRTDAWAEGTLIWCSNTRIERDLEFWNWEGIHGFISLTLSIGLLRRNSINKSCSRTSQFLSSVSTAQSLCNHYDDQWDDSFPSLGLFW